MEKTELRIRFARNVFAMPPADPGGEGYVTESVEAEFQRILAGCWRTFAKGSVALEPGDTRDQANDGAVRSAYVHALYGPRLNMPATRALVAAWFCEGSRTATIEEGD